MEEPYKQQLQTIKDNVPKVYEAGRSAGYKEGHFSGELNGYANGKEAGYSEGYEVGYSGGLQAGFADGNSMGYKNGYEDGYNSAVMEGTITILESTKELKIEGLPKAPKTYTVVSPQSNVPATDDIRFIKSLEYKEAGIGKKGSITILAIMTTLTSSSVSTSNFSADTITELHNTNQNLITFENGVFAIKMRDSSKARFAEGFTYQWIATF